MTSSEEPPQDKPITNVFNIFSKKLVIAGETPVPPPELNPDPVVPTTAKSIGGVTIGFTYAGGVLQPGLDDPFNPISLPLGPAKLPPSDPEN